MFYQKNDAGKDDFSADYLMNDWLDAIFAKCYGVHGGFMMMTVSIHLPKNIVRTDGSHSFYGTSLPSM